MKNKKFFILTILIICFSIFVTGCFLFEEEEEKEYDVVFSVDLSTSTPTDSAEISYGKNSKVTKEVVYSSWSKQIKAKENDRVSLSAVSIYKSSSVKAALLSGSITIDGTKVAENSGYSISLSGFVDDYLGLNDDSGDGDGSGTCYCITNYPDLGRVCFPTYDNAEENYDACVAAWGSCGDLVGPTSDCTMSKCLKN